MPFVRSCLKLSKSPLVEGDIKAAAAEASVKPTTTKRYNKAALNVPNRVKRSCAEKAVCDRFDGLARSLRAV